jgi:4-amino-4-deoxy-L-arabinose transferase-like glycosyltransferase
VLCAFQFMYQMKRAQIDPLVTFWITMANWGLLRHLLRGPDWRAYWLGCFAAGLGVITKGVGVLALLMLVPYAVARWRGWEGVVRTERSAGRWLLGAAAFLAAIALWLVPMVLAVKARGAPEYDAYLDDILFKQTAKRYADSWVHAQPFWYYVPILLFNWFPLSLAYPGLVPQWWRDLRAGDARLLLPLAWFAMVLVFFSIPTGKRDVYLLPALPMVALAAAPYLERLVQTRWLRMAALIVTIGGGLVVVGAGARTLHGGWATAQRFLERRELVDDATTVVSLVVAAGVVMLLAAAWFRLARGVHALLAGLAAFWLIWGLGVYPVLNDSSSARGVMRRTGEIIGPDAELGLVAWKEQNYLMADRPVADFGFKQPFDEQFRRGVAWQAQAPDKRWLFALEKSMADCVDRDKATHVGHANRREWWVFRADAVHAACAPKADAVDEQDAAEAPD